MRILLTISFFVVYILIIGLVFVALHSKTEIIKPIKAKQVQTLTPEEIRTRCYINASSKVVNYRNKLCSLENKEENCTLTTIDQSDANNALIKLNKACEGN